MLLLRNILTTGLLLIFLSASAVNGIEKKAVDSTKADFNQIKTEQVNKYFQYMVALGSGSRLDKGAELSHFPSITIRVYHFLTHRFAVKGGFAYNHDTRINTSWTSERIGIRNIMVETGVRYQIPIWHYGLFLEGGGNYNHYLSADGTGSDSRTGWFLLLGNSFELSGRSSFEISISKTLNYMNYDDDVDLLYPCVGEYCGNSSTPFIKALYNPTELLITFNFKL